MKEVVHLKDDHHLVDSLTIHSGHAWCASAPDYETACWLFEGKSGIILVGTRNDGADESKDYRDRGYIVISDSLQAPSPECRAWSAKAGDTFTCGGFFVTVLDVAYSKDCPAPYVTLLEWSD